MSWALLPLLKRTGAIQSIPCNGEEMISPTDPAASTKVVYMAQRYCVFKSRTPE